MFKEAEARGAEEQRRKDAEGQAPVAWVDAEDLPNGECQRKPCHLVLKRTPIYSTALYTRPANIAALEDRIAELVEAEQLARADAKASKARVMELTAVLDGIKTYSEDTLAGPVGGGGDISWFKDGVEEAFRRARATLTREGGV